MRRRGGTARVLSVALLVGAAPQAQAALPAFAPDANLERSQVPALYKWDLTPLFPDDAAFEKALQQAAAGRARFAAFRGKLADPARLKACLDLYFKERLATNRLTLYAQLRYSTDQRSAYFKAMDDRALKAMNDFMLETAFIRQELTKLDDAALKKALAKEPKLAEYKPWMDEIRRRRGRLVGPEGERVLALAGDNLWAEIDINELPSDHEKAFRAALTNLPLPKLRDETGTDVQLTLSNLVRYRSSSDRRVRRDAMEKLFGTLNSFRDLFAATLSGQVNTNILFARSRGYETALQAYMDKDNIDPAVYHNLIKTVRANLQPLRRYVELRKRVMGLRELRVFDLYAPLVPTVKKEISYGRAVELIPAALAPLGEEYVNALGAGLQPVNGWLDLYPNKGKMSGASCTSVYGVHPFVRMNYLNDFEGLSTLAHEYGHAMHSVLAMRAQPYPTANYSMLIAEIASTFNEKLLSDYLVEQSTSPEEKLYVLNRLVESIRTTLYRQTLFAEFELAAHTAAEQGVPLTAEFLRRTYGELIRAYYGPNLALGPNDDMEWAYVPHFYYKFYVYSYAAGLSSALALAQKVKTEGEPAREAYLGMLKGGSSKPPLALLKDAGVDLTRPDAIEAATRLMDRTLAEMEQLLPQTQPTLPLR